MTPNQFKEFWEANYPETLPISYLFKYEYPDRWFRIHSLPDSQRYPNTEQEWSLLLNRQNTVITDILGDNAEVLLVTWDFAFDKSDEAHITEHETILINFSFQRIDDINLHALDPEQYSQGSVHRPAFAEVLWKPSQYDGLLKAIANDELRAFFISLDRHSIAAPYDGGIDFVLADPQTRNFYENRYQDWLSARADGM